MALVRRVLRLIVVWALDLAGAVALAVAAWSVAPALGLAVIGVALLLAAMLLESGRR